MSYDEKRIMLKIKFYHYDVPLSVFDFESVDSVHVPTGTCTGIALS